MWNLINNCENLTLLEIVYKKIVDDKITDHLVTETNWFGEQKNGNGWKATNTVEITKFLGIICYMGIVKYSRIADYWSRKILYRNNVVPKIMPRSWFQLLLRMIHFADNENADPNDRSLKIRTLVDKLCIQFSDFQIPGEFLSVDESVIKFWGRVIFRQYIPDKSLKYVINIFKICNPTGHTYKTIVYSGKGTESNDNQRVSDQVVMNLINDYVQEGRTLPVDNYYTNLEVAQKLI